MKNILLFSDGTGNSSGKLFKTNVWRMYEAVDLGLTTPDQPVQIAYYDNGVGTSKIKAIAWIAGIFGFGLQRNVRAIYRYVCRNYERGDKIYCFGFSRGAFTIRLVAALLATRGIATYNDERELKARTRDVVRDFQKENEPNLIPWLTQFNRWVRTGLITLKRAAVGPRYKIRPSFGGQPIQFIGVWDTVAAYGGPSAEITRAIDNFIYPLTMTDQCLSTNVRFARHALSIDDERDAFHPLLWDEWDWAEKARKRHPNNLTAQTRFNRRVQQVWFAGVHSDVGGGYPDESLSYVSLAWMMQEATEKGVRFLDEARDRIQRVSNSLGPIHNSRGGLASYYRFQPRRIEAFFHKSALGARAFELTRTYREPIQGERKYPPQGYLLSCKVHESVLARIAKATDDYAPIVLPPTFSIVNFNFGNAGGNPRLTRDLRRRLSGRKPLWWQNRERIYDLVWWRRVTYFATVIVSAALVLTPLYALSLPFPRTTDNQWIFGRLTSGAKVLPDVIQPWVRAFQSSPILFIGLAVVTAILSVIGGSLERSIRSKMRGLWLDRIRHRRLERTGTSVVRWLRTARAYQHAIQDLKWYILPGLIGVLMLFAIGYSLWVLAVQSRLSAVDPGLCPRTVANPATLPSDGEAAVEFKTSSMCNRTQLHVRTGQPYSVEFAVPTDARTGKPNWKDASYDTDPRGFPAHRLGAVGLLGAPVRRLVDARYMQVIYEIRPLNDAKGARQPVFVHALDFAAPDTRNPKCWIYRADFVANGEGELFLFVNDSVGLLKPDRFYTSPEYGNHGSANVYLHELHALGASPPHSAALDRDPCKLTGRKKR